MEAKVTPPRHQDTKGLASRFWMITLLAGVLGAGTWVVLHFLVPVSVPEDFPKLPDLQGKSPELRALLTQADADARNHPGSADDAGRLGMIYHSNQFYEQAGGAYRIAARLDPGDYRWPYCQALMEEENGRDQEFIASLLRTVHLKDDYAPALVRLGDLYFKQDNLKEAERYYERSSPALQAVFGLGRIAGRRADWKRVADLLAPLSREHPQFRPPHQLLADAYQALGQPEKSAEEIRYLDRTDLTVVPPVDDPLSSEILGLCCSSTRLLKQAGYLSRFSFSNEVLRLSRRAVEVEPNDPDARHFLAIVLLNVRGADPAAVDEALALLTEGLRLRPGDTHPLVLAAEVFFKHRKTSQAIERMHSLLAPGAKTAEERFYLGLAADRLGRTDEAVANYRMALKASPEYVEPNYHLGVILAKQGNRDQAIECFRRAVRIRPAYARAHFNLALALEQKGNTAEAAKEYGEVLRLDNNDFEAQVNLGLILGRSGRLAEAAGHFREAVRINPGDAQAHYALGYALAGLRRSDEAATEFREALRLRPDYAGARRQLEQLDLARH